MAIPAFIIIIKKPSLLRKVFKGGCPPSKVWCCGSWLPKLSLGFLIQKSKALGHGALRRQLLGRWMSECTHTPACEGGLCLATPSPSGFGGDLREWPPLLPWPWWEEGPCLLEERITTIQGTAFSFPITHWDVYNCLPYLFIQTWFLDEQSFEFSHFQVNSVQFRIFSASSALQFRHIQVKTPLQVFFFFLSHLPGVDSNLLDSHAVALVSLAEDTVWASIWLVLDFCCPSSPDSGPCPRQPVGQPWASQGLPLRCSLRASEVLCEPDLPPSSDGWRSVSIACL